MSVALSALATFVAALFGVQLKAEGPKKLLEVLLKPKVLMVAILSNLAIVGAIKIYTYTKNLPSFEFWVSTRQSQWAQESQYSYTNVLEQAPAPIIHEKPPSLGISVSQTAHQKRAKGSFRGAVISGDRFFIGGDDGYLAEYSTSDLSLIRKFYIGTKVSPAPVIYKDNIYVGEGTHNTHHARIYKFDLKTGRYMGSLQTKGHTEGQAVIGVYKNMARIFAVGGSDGVIAADLEALSPLWHQIDGHTDAAVRVWDGLIFAASGREKNDGSSYRAFATTYEFETGKKVWQRELPASSWMQPTIVGKDVCFVFGEVYFKSNVGGFACFDQKTGRSRASYMHFNPVVAVPIVVGEDLIISDFMGSVCRVSSVTGQAKWCRETSRTKYSLANAMYDPDLNVLVYPSQKDGLYILSPKDGHIIQYWKPTEGEWKETMAPVSFSKNGWILVDMEGNIRLLKASPTLNARLDTKLSRQ